MSSKTIIKYAFLHAVGATVYIALVATLMFKAEGLFGQANNLVGITALLLLFVVSAAITGLLVFGRPVLWCLNGSKKEAVRLSLYTVGFLALFAIIIFLTLAVRNVS